MFSLLLDLLNYFVCFKDLFKEAIARFNLRSPDLTAIRLP